MFLVWGDGPKVTPYTPLSLSCRSRSSRDPFSGKSSARLWFVGSGKQFAEQLLGAPPAPREQFCTVQVASLSRLLMNDQEIATGKQGAPSNL